MTTYAWTGSGYVAPSAAAKGGFLALTRSLAAEWAKYNININDYSTRTFPTKGAWERLNPNGDDGSVMGEVPLGRVGEMGEIAKILLPF